MTTWIIATRNKGKLAELIPMLAAHGITGIGLDDAGIRVSIAEDDIERFDTFVDNARAKAEYFAAVSGMPCVADDSGLCIDALDGAPGVRSRRFAGDRGHIVLDAKDEDRANNEAVVDACWDSGRAPPWRACYECAAAYADAAGSMVTVGRTDGAILPDRSGDGGFGYDPYFVSADLGVSFAVASAEEKARVSHRGRALAALLANVAAARANASPR